MSKSNSRPSRLIVPVVLIGGEGTRIYPLSTPERPKPFQELFSRKTLLAETLARVQGAGFAPPLLIANHKHKSLLAKMSPKTTQCFEPAGRNTAAAIGVAAALAQQQWGDVCLLVLPSDHYIARTKQYRQLLLQAQKSAQAGNIVTFGIVPSRPHTGLGYIQAGAGAKPVGKKIAKFCEKPDLATATRWVKSGRFFWNSGMFMAQASTFMDELTRNKPTLAKGVQSAVANAKKSRQSFVLPASFAKLESLPFDIAVMEKTKRGVVLPADIGWSDIGSYQALWELLPKDKNGNALGGSQTGEIVAGKNNYVYSTKGQPPVIVAGLDNVAVVQTKQGVLVVPHEKDQLVKQVATTRKTQK